MTKYLSLTWVKVTAAAVAAVLAAVAAIVVVTSRANAAEQARLEKAAHERALADQVVAQEEQDWLREQKVAAARAAAKAAQVERAAKVDAANKVVEAAGPVVAAAAGKVDPAPLSAAVDALKAAIGTGVFTSIDTASAAVAAEQQKVTDAIAAYDAEQARIAAEQAAAAAAKPTSGSKSTGGTKPSSGTSGGTSGGSKPSGGTSSSGGTSGGSGSGSPSANWKAKYGTSGPVRVTSCKAVSDTSYKYTFAFADQTGGGTADYLMLAENMIDGMMMSFADGSFFYSFTNPGAFAAACGA